MNRRWLCTKDLPEERWNGYSQIFQIISNLVLTLMLGAAQISSGGMRLCPRNACSKCETICMRAIWKGSISFGLVNIPIALYPATRKEELKFRMLRAKDLSPINYKRV